jgi:single-stranded-DNA-specific exonuclease
MPLPHTPESVSRECQSAADLIPETDVDAELDLAILNGETMAEVRRLEPYGQGNTEPIFLTRKAQVMSARIVGGNPTGQSGHLKLLLRSSQGGRPIDAIGFGMADAPVTLREKLDVLYTPEINMWNGNASLQLRIKDLQIAY